MNSSGRKRRAPASSRSRQQSSPPKRTCRAKTPDSSLLESDDEIVDIVSCTEEDESALATIEANSIINEPAKKDSSLNKAILIPKKQGAVWEHILRSIDNDNIVLSCKYCKKTWSYTEEEFRKQGSSTGNQRKHLNSMHKKQMQGNHLLGPMDAFLSKASDIEKKIATNPNVSDDLIREAIENFIMSELEPFTIIESEPFLTLLKLCLKCKRDNVFLPKADALRNGILKRADHMKGELVQLMAKDSAAVHLCLDAWTSSNQFSFLAITAHYIDSDWKLVEKLIAFQDTTDHTGVGMAAIVRSVLDEFELTSRLGCLTMDNASNNDTLARSLRENLQDVCNDWSPEEGRIPCLPHMINLAVKSFLKFFDDGELPENESTVSPIKRLRYVVRKLRSSPSQRQKFLGHCELANVDKLMLILDVPTRWNSTFYMIKRAIKVREGLKNWLSTDPEIGKVKLGFFQLTSAEWKILEKMCFVLEKFESASNMMSGGTYPTLSLVMPVFIELFTFIEKESEKCSEIDDLKEPLGAAHGVLAKYFSFTDDSPYYLYAVLLDPRFKKTYLDRKGFATDYPGLIEATVSKLKTLVKNKASNDDSAADIQKKQNERAEDEEDSLFCSMFSHCHSDGQELDEVDRYLELRCEDRAVDPVEYWKTHAKQFPCLSSVARDVLSIPGSSVAVERIFNCGRDVIGLRRHSLKPETFSALTFGKCYLK
jgi:hypothetical protein